MRQFITVIASAALALSVQANPKALNLWYGSPATTWNEALPIGNGRLAAMVFGNPVCEQFQINEETISNGSPYSNHNPDTPKYLDNLRQLIFSENILLARLDWRASPTWALARRIGDSCWLLGHVGHEHLAKWSWRSIKLIPGLPDSVQPAQAEQ